MSNFLRRTRHPETGVWQPAAWIDDHFGRHRYGVMFPDGRVFDPDKVEMPTEDKPTFATRMLGTSSALIDPAGGGNG